MSANLYDILDVDASASVEDIRAAWKSAVADLDPTDRRFRAYNDAAAVLLDPDKRAAYDAELAAAGHDDAPGDAAAAEAPVVLTKDSAAATTVTAPAPKPDPKPDQNPDREPEPKPDREPDPRSPRAQAGPPSWALLAAGVAAFVALVLAVVLALLPGGIVFADESPQDVVAAERRFEESSRSVEAAAERMIADVFSYNYETMDADLERAQQYVTPELGAKQAEGWPQIAKDAADQKLVVQARAEAVALTRLSTDAENATVVVFLIQNSTRNGVDQTPLRMWVSLNMVREDGSADSWLIDDVCVDSTCDQVD